MAHAHHLGNGLHRQSFPIRNSDRLVTLNPQRLGSLLQLAFAACELLCECRETFAGFRCLTFRTGDSPMNRPSYSC